MTSRPGRPISSIQPIPHPLQPFPMTSPRPPYLPPPSSSHSFRSVSSSHGQPPAPALKPQPYRPLIPPPTTTTYSQPTPPSSRSGSTSTHKTTNTSFSASSSTSFSASRADVRQPHRDDSYSSSSSSSSSRHRRQHERETERERRQDAFHELEQRVRRCQDTGMRAHVELQTATRRVVDENRLLREMLGDLGVSELEIENRLAAMRRRAGEENDDGASRKGGLPRAENGAPTGSSGGFVARAKVAAAHRLAQHDRTASMPVSMLSQAALPASLRINAPPRARTPEPPSQRAQNAVRKPVPAPVPSQPTHADDDDDGLDLSAVAPLLDMDLNAFLSLGEALPSPPPRPDPAPLSPVSPASPVDNRPPSVSGPFMMLGRTAAPAAIKLAYDAFCGLPSAEAAVCREGTAQGSVATKLVHALDKVREVEKEVWGIVVDVWEGFSGFAGVDGERERRGEGARMGARAERDDSGVVHM